VEGRLLRKFSGKKSGFFRSRMNDHGWGEG